jgi:EF hand
MMVTKNRLFGWTISAVLAVGAAVGIRSIADGQKTSGSLSGGEQWLAAMNTDKDATVDKQEFTAYMDAQFDKVDVDHDGTLDAKELEQLRKNLWTVTKK